MYVIIALSRRGKERKKDERKNALCNHWRSPLKFFWEGDCNGATEEVRMHDLHFAANDICIAPGLANLALKTWMV